MSTKKKIAEGKTKIIWSTPWPDVYLMESKDDITAGDGAKRDILKDKGALATETTQNCFVLLEANGIRTHFIDRFSRRTLIVRKVEMIPIEFVARRIATGSYLKRNPDVVEGTVFDELVFEAFWKDDALHDPLIQWKPWYGNRFELFDPKKPFGEGFIKYLELRDSRVARTLKTGRFRLITERVFHILEQAWAELGVTLVDLKIEFGWTQSGDLVVADVIDNDSWRIWPGGEKSRMKDKQVYRDSKDVSVDVLAALYENYSWVAKQTRKFLLVE